MFRRILEMVDLSLAFLGNKPKSKKRLTKRTDCSADTHTIGVLVHKENKGHILTEV